MSYTDPVAFGWVDDVVVGMASDENIPEIKDRILYWPSLLALVWLMFSLIADSDPGEGMMVPGPLFTFGLPLLSAGIALMICTVWVFHRTWRRLLSTLILPVSVILIITFIGGW
jgi:carbon starvation protein CstA